MKALSKLFAMCLLVLAGGVAGYVLHDRVPSIQIRESDCTVTDEAGAVVFEHGPSNAQLLAQINDRLERLEGALQQDEAVDLADDEVHLAATNARLDELHERIADVEETTDEVVVTRNVATKRRAPVTAAAVQEWQNVISTPNTDEERLQALRRLRFTPKALAPHAPIADSIVHWMDSTQDLEVREDIIRQLHGAHVEALIEPLIHYLQNSPSEKVREEAAETLSDYYTDPAVAQALRQAMERDESRDVRSEAAQSLHGGKHATRDDDDKRTQFRR